MSLQPSQSLQVLQLFSSAPPVDAVSSTAWEVPTAASTPTGSWSAASATRGIAPRSDALRMPRPPLDDP